MPTTIMRLNEVHGRGRPIPVGLTKFYEDFVYRDGEDEFIPGTAVKRLRTVKLGLRAVGFFADEVFALVEALRAARDSEAPSLIPSHEQVGRGRSASASARRKDKASASA
jgi:hypothetical protein